MAKLLLEMQAEVNYCTRREVPSLHFEPRRIQSNATGNLFKAQEESGEDEQCLWSRQHQANKIPEGQGSDSTTLLKLLLRDGQAYTYKGGGEILSDADLGVLCDRSEDAYMGGAGELYSFKSTATEDNTQKIQKDYFAPINFPSLLKFCPPENHLQINWAVSRPTSLSPKSNLVAGIIHPPAQTLDPFLWD
ncbi:hypothetical protein VC83_01914 [Pseudogymnoascus destructans]|uniref:Uncharacterized protein n=1 Tax=Pseudogymnoascus destructans TaxID=655981 RepID=A0A177AH76_9PEZI|nr:uncharacterized protein VC83_01914 [Pseudogymnoascus destructans]OAF61465.1 hypothetical protein VC83_01914 [Pseudogymnoascus destructans]